MTNARTFSWDDTKAAKNLASHGVAFDTVRLFDFDAAMEAEDTRQAYGETRIIAIGPAADRVHVLVYTMRGETVRVISFRKANSREIARYEAFLEDDT